MKNYFILFFLINYELIQSQSTLQVDYSFFANLGMPRTDTWTLFSNKNDNLFLLKNNIVENISKKEGEDFMAIKLKLDKGFTQHICQNLETDSIYFQGLVINKSYYIHDKIAKQNWNITEETKKINNYNCYKATTSFRGRDYVAWFTPDIACKAGPWKFNSLPGLILELYDLNKEIIITAISIEMNNLDVKEHVKKIPKLGEKIHFRDYVKLQDNSSLELLKFAASQTKTTEDATLEYELPKSRNDIEIKYEWED